MFVVVIEMSLKIIEVISILVGQFWDYIGCIRGLEVNFDVLFDGKFFLACLSDVFNTEKFACYG